MATKLFDSTSIPGYQETEGFLTNVLEASTEYAIIGTDLDGKILFVDGAHGGCTTTKAQEVVGLVNVEMLHTRGEWPRQLEVHLGCRSAR